MREIRSPLDGFSSPLGPRRGRAFSPAALFAASEPGAWYDPSDLTTLFQDTAGATPVTAAGQSVARVNDKSGRGNNATQATAASRPTYQVDGSGRGYLAFDGVDDFLLTPTITPNIDKVQVFAGVRKLSDNPQGHITGGNGNSIGQFELLSGGWSVAANRYGAGFFTDILSQIDSPASFAPPRTDVLSWRFDMNGATGPDKAKLNVNAAAQSLSIAGVPSAGNFGAFAHYIGSRGGTSLPFNGQLYSLIVRFGANLDAGTIASTERFVGGKTGVVL